jgi:hypothetical protein
MPANFPTNPSVGDRHTIADKTWEYTGNVWDLVVSTNTLQFSGDDSSVITVDLAANEELRIVGDGTNITTSGAAGDSSNSTLQINLGKSIDVNTIASTDSSAVTINDGLIVTGSLSFTGGTAVTNILDEDNLSSDSATALATQQSIKAYVDSQITSSNTLSVADDTSTSIAINLDNTLTIAGGDSLTTTASGSTLTIDLDETISVDQINAGDSSAITIGSPTIFNSTLKFNTDGTVAVSSIKDEDDMSSNSATALATQQSIKAYVDSQTSSIVTTIGISDSSSNTSTLTLGSQDLEFRSGDSITATVAGTGVTFDLNETITVDQINAGDSTTIKFGAPITVNTISSADSSAVRINDSLETDGATINGNLQVSGDTTIDGNLTVAGTTTYIETTNTKISDPILLLNNGNSGGSDIDAGIMVERGSAGNNAVFYWNEGDNVFKAVTSISGADAVAVTDTALANVRVAEPSDSTDAATKNYVDSQIASSQGTINFVGDDSVGASVKTGETLQIRGGDNVTVNVEDDSTVGQAIVTINTSASVITDGTQIQLGTPTDSSTFPVGAISTLTTTHTITDSIDDLNEALENVRNNTFVKSVDFTADNTVGGAGLVVTLTITAVGNANRYDITWGDGNTTIGTTDSTPTHTYNTNVGSPFDVTVRAYNNAGEGTGSEATETKSNFITIFTANPVVQYEFYAASSGGSAITKCDLGSTIYLKNTTTNTTGVTATFSIDWGDGVTETISANNAAGGVDGARLAHTYDRPDAGDSSTTLVGDGDLRFQPRLTLLTHSTANPTEVPKSSSTSYLYVYAEHEPLLSVDGSTIRGVNEEGTSGFPVTFNNDTITRPGAYSTFNTNSGSNTYVWDFGDNDSTVTTVQVGSGSAGDTAVDISKTFALTSGEQTAGTTKTYHTVLTINNGHSNSPFRSDLNIIVEPDVRANISGTAVTVSTGSGDNSLSLYDHTDLDGNNRALARFTNTSQNADDYEYDFFNDSSDVKTVQEDGSAAGSIGAVLDKNFTGTSNGAFTTDFKATGTPDTIHQTDAETVTFTMKAVPSAPANLSTKSITLSDSAQGTNPHLCASADDNTGSFTSLSAGDSCETSTVRRYTSGTIDTSTASNFFNGASGTLSAVINGSADGAKAFSTAENETGTFTSLVVSSNVDYDTVDSSYPQRFYLVASAKITKALSGYTVGVNAQRLEHSSTGNTNLVYVVKDDITATPTTTIGTVTQGTAGTFRYVSGLPYYNTGSPTLTVTGSTVANFTGQCYQDTSSPHEVDPGTNQESTSGNVISATNYTYANIDGASTMLSGGIPVADTGVSSAYTLGALTVPITSSSVKTVQRIKARSTNANGSGSYNESATNIQVFTSTPTLLDKEDGGIVVSDSLGAGFDDDAVRIYTPNAFYSDSSSTSVGDTPQYNSATNFYTTHAFAGTAADVVASTDEAICRLGTIAHNTTNYSSGYLPAGPDLSSGRSGAQYYTIAFRRTTMANFTLTFTGTVRGVFIAAPGTGIDSASTLNGWLDASVAYAGSGVPGADTGNGGNGSNGCAFTTGDRITAGTHSNASFTLTLGSENATNASGNNVLVRFKLHSGDSISAISIA